MNSFGFIHIIGEFWDRVTSVRRRNQFSVLLADKYAESWGKVTSLFLHAKILTLD